MLTIRLRMAKLPRKTAILQRKMVILRGKMATFRARIAILKVKIALLRSRIAILRPKIAFLPRKIAILHRKNQERFASQIRYRAPFFPSLPLTRTSSVRNPACCSRFVNAASGPADQTARIPPGRRAP